MTAFAVLASLLSLHLSGPRAVLGPLDAPRVLATVGYVGPGSSGTLTLAISASGGTLRPQRGTRCDRSATGWRCYPVPMEHGATEPQSFLVTGLTAGTPLVVHAAVTSTSAPGRGSARATLRRPVRGLASAARLLATQDAWPVWSPDRRTIAFTRIHPGRNLMELYVLDVKTRAATKLAQNSFQLQPSWSPDGKSLAYQSGGDVYVAGLDGTKRRIGKGGSPAYGPSIARVVNGDLVVDGVVWAQHVIGRPAWSPDGTRVAFRRDDGIYVTAGPGGELLLVGGANPGDPSWSPDGAQVAFTIRDEVWVGSRGLLPAHAIARKKPDPSTPSWSSDGTAVVYSWRGGVERTTLEGRSALLHAPAGSGVSVSGDRVAWIGPRPGCPGHLGLVLKTTLTGSCLIQGSPRADVIEGTPLWGDVIQAGAGDDKIHANDGHSDRVSCGPGRDEVWADRTDKLTGCEIVHR